MKFFLFPSCFFSLSDQPEGQLFPCLPLVLNLHHCDGLQPIFPLTQLSLPLNWMAGAVPTRSPRVLVKPSPRFLSSCPLSLSKCFGVLRK